MFYSGFDALFSILFPLVFLVVLGMILFTIVGNLRTWSKNNASPRLTVNTNESGHQLQRPLLFCCGQAFFFRSLGAVAL